ATFVDALPSPTSTAGADQIFTFDTLPAGQSIWVIVHALAPATAGTIVDRARVSAPGDVNAANDTASTSTIVEPNACAVAPAGLVGLWRGDGSPADSSGGGRDGVLHDGVSYGPGAHGSAFALDGTSGYVDVPTSNLND